MKLLRPAATSLLFVTAPLLSGCGGDPASTTGTTSGATATTTGGCSGEGCGGGGGGHGGSSGATTGGGSSTIEIDCLGDANCPARSILGDKPSLTSPLRGYADPSVRRSLDGSTLYLGYSYPTFVETSNGMAHSIQSHLASSIDEGKTWNLEPTLFAYPSAAAIPGSSSGDLDAISSEEITLSAAALDPTQKSRPYWISARQKYWSDPSDNGEPYPGKTGAKTWHLRVGAIQGDSPAGLGGHEDDEQVLTAAVTDPMIASALAPDANRRSFADILGDLPCRLPVSSALHVEGNVVYLAVECDASIAVIKTTPYQHGAVQPATSWEWTYVGNFGTADDAALMRSGASLIIQPDLATSTDGTLLFIGTPTVVSQQGTGRIGCNVVEMEGIDPPRLKKKDGKLVTRAIIRTTDLEPTQFAFGTQAGSCSYEPSARHIGLLQARKVTASEVIHSTLNDTGYHE